MGGLKCRACRRFVLRRWHVVFLILLAIVAAVGVLEVVERLTPPPLKK
jgi:heme A synthase